MTPQASGGRFGVLSTFHGGMGSVHYLFTADTKDTLDFKCHIWYLYVSD